MHSFSNLILFVVSYRMIDAVYIFTRGGLVLWSFELIPVESGVLDSFIKNFLLEHRAGENKYSAKDYEFQWLSVNRLHAFIVVVYKGILQGSYVDTLLNGLKAKVIQRSIPDQPATPLDLSGDFMNILDRCDRLSPGKGPSPLVGQKAPEVDSRGGQSKSKKEKRVALGAYLTRQTARRLWKSWIIPSRHRAHLP